MDYVQNGQTAVKALVSVINILSSQSKDGRLAVDSLSGPLEAFVTQLTTEVAELRREVEDLKRPSP